MYGAGVLDFRHAADRSDSNHPGKVFPKHRSNNSAARWNCSDAATPHKL